MTLNSRGELNFSKENLGSFLCYFSTVVMAALALPAQAPSCGLLLLCDQIFWNMLLNTAESACLPLIVLINCACWECLLGEGCLLSSSSWDQSYRSPRDCLWSVGVAFIAVKSTGRQAVVRLVVRGKGSYLTSLLSPFAVSALEVKKGKEEDFEDGRQWAPRSEKIQCTSWK